MTMATTRHARLARVRERMEALGVDVLLLSHGADLPWLTGYRAMPLERLTLLVLSRTDEPVLLVPMLEAPRVPDHDGLVRLRPWDEAEDPLALAADLLRPWPAGTLAVSDRAWAVTVLGLQAHMPHARFVAASTVTASLRAVKDEDEVRALRAAAAAADRVAAALQGGQVRLVGRSERQVSEEISARLIAEGHRRVNFAIVASGPNAASPHHDAGNRVIGPDEVVVCDFGGELALPGDEVGYCSDITRTVVTGEAGPEVVECYEVLRRAQGQGVQAARAGVPAEEVDRVARAVIDEAGYGQHFIHRTGHGIGIEEHEDPYLVSGNRTPLEPGHVFSVEPGIYLPTRFGMRLEDIVVVGAGGPESLNVADHGLVPVEV
jgi:Xaa-Pro aminopeptidase